MAVMIQSSLEEGGIKVVVLDHHDSALTVLGDIELYVAPENEEKAKAIIANSGSGE